MTTFTWQVAPMKVQSIGGMSNVVAELLINLIADDGDVRRIKTAILPLSSPDENDFIAYEQLNEQQVLDWGLSALGEEQIEAMQQALIDEIEMVKNSGVAVEQPTTVAPPWVVAGGNT